MLKLLTTLLVFSLLVQLSLQHGYGHRRTHKRPRWFIGGASRGSSRGGYGHQPITSNKFNYWSDPDRPAISEARSEIGGFTKDDPSRSLAHGFGSKAKKILNREDRRRRSVLSFK